ncbi:hypothetical protein [Herbaspirillum sp.]|uniref:hypothetical protein n=1 Tax=Herbaspirillum sp. TaxID=1890675 RepID=UPI0031CEB8DA
MSDELEIPDDFPRVGVASSVTGAQSKFSMVKHGERYYSPGNTPPERQEQWMICNELVEGYSSKCQRAKEGKRAHMTHEEILAGYYEAELNANPFIDTAQLKWVFRKVASRLGWPPLNG